MVDRCAICGVLLRPSSRPPKDICERGTCAREFRRRLRAEPGARACPVCGRQIDPDIAGNSCGEDYCREELGSRLHRARQEQERTESKEASARRVEIRLRESRAVPGDGLTAILPADDRPILPQDPARRTLFAERLSGLMEDAAADPDGPTGDPPYPEASANAGDTLARAACASCRGLCCKHGELHAFMRPATLRRYLKLHPAQTPERALATYLSYIPAESAAGSCIYHGRQGCTLPRAMRSDVCNRFFCDDLERLQKSVGAGETPPPIVAVGFDGERLVRVSILES